MKFWKVLLTVCALIVQISIASAQVFVFRDHNQELLGLVANIADGYDERSTNFPIRFYEEYCGLYGQMRGWLEDTEAVSLMKELMEHGYDMDDIPVMGLVYKPGFAEIRPGYILPDFLCDPQDGAYETAHRLLGSLQTLYQSEEFSSYLEFRYPADYQKAVDGSDAIFAETGEVLEMTEDVLGVSPPENFLNFFSLFATPGQNRSGLIARNDGSRVIYVVTGITYESHEPVFDISPELLLSAYSYAVVHNAVLENPDFDIKSAQAVTAPMEENPLQHEDLEEYMIGNAAMALTAFIFDHIGNKAYCDMLLNMYEDRLVYVRQMFHKLKDGFMDSGRSFYDYFPALFSDLETAE